MVTYIHKGKTYEIIIEDEGKYSQQRKEIILNDFLVCEKNGDYNTVKNRMTNGLKWGWLKLIN